MPTTHAAVAAALIASLEATGRYGRVRYGKEQVEVEPGLISAVLFESEEEVLAQADKTATVRQPYILEITGPCDADDPRIAAHANADFALAALFSDASIRRLEPLLSIHASNRHRLAYSGRVVLPRQDGQVLVTVQVKFNACFVICFA